MLKKLDYDKLENHFTSPKIISPFYSYKTKIPRKLKKKVKIFCGTHYKRLDNAQRLWYYLEKSNPNYKRFLIKEMCNKS